jgi:hypothetical protein
MRISKRNNNKEAISQDKHDVIDLASSINEAKASANNNTFLCKYCIEPLVFYPQARIDNPHAGPSYICPKCGVVVDSSLEKLPKASKKVTSSIGSPTNNIPFIETIAENAGQNTRESEYDKYNPEPDEEEQLKAMGATLIESRIELTDRQGHNRTYVKRNDDNDTSNESVYW